MSSRPATSRPAPAPESAGATDRAAFDILSALERRELAPGQRLIETELAAQLGVGRNAVREAIQRLAAKGVIDMSRHRSPSIRKLDMAETMEVLEVAETMFALVARVAARNFSPSAHAARLRQVLGGLAAPGLCHDRNRFSEVRRQFYRTLLEIGANRELHRHFSAIQMQIIYVQFESPELADLRVADYGAIGAAVMKGEIREAESLARRHVGRVRKIIQKMQPAAKRLGEVT